MRISDWSSDVCSSDLHRVDRGIERVGAGVVARRQDGIARLRGRDQQNGVAGRCVAVDGDAVERLAGRLAPHVLQTRGSDELGSAACRERECQGSGVTGGRWNLKKKITQDRKKSNTN